MNIFILTSFQSLITLQCFILCVHFFTALFLISVTVVTFCNSVHLSSAGNFATDYTIHNSQIKSLDSS